MLESIHSNISVYLGKNDIQNLDKLAPGQSFFFYPKPETNLEKINITAKEGINLTTDYRTPLKGIGLPGSGR
jgi:glucose-6-phosphate 1-dehydrogenase